MYYYGLYRVIFKVDESIKLLLKLFCWMVFLKCEAMQDLNNMDPRLYFEHIKAPSSYQELITLNQDVM